MKPAAKAARDKATIIAWRDQFLTKRDAADAQLIEAAPDLLDALQMVAQQNRDLLAALEEAIEFATDKRPIHKWCYACKAGRAAGMTARAAIAKATGEAV